MSLFSLRESQPQTTNKRKRRPEGVSRRRKRDLGFEPLEDRRVMSAESPLAQLKGMIAEGVAIQTRSYSSATLEGQLAILQNELMWAALANNGNFDWEAAARSIPTDPLLNLQWHLINSGQSVGNPDFQPIFAVPGEDINVGPVWNQNIKGNGVVVGVYELGAFQTTHPDLIGNVDPLLRFLGTGNTGLSDHATAVAGLIGASADNGIGGTGVAPGVTLVPMSGVVNSALGFRYALDNGIDVVNNSWGPVLSRGIVPATPDEILALRDAVLFGRDNKGVIFVFASGNSAGAPFNEGFPDLGSWDSSTYDGTVSSRYTIGVTGVDHDGFYNNVDGTVFSYAEMSAGILVAAPTGSWGFIDIIDDTGIGSGIVTTDLVGEAGYNQSGFVLDRDFLADTNYTSRFNGTSAAAPLVSGVVALMLEANPELTWRDVQEILVRSARQNAKFDIPETQANGFTQNTWIINQTPVFHDPDVYDPTVDPFVQTYTPTLDPNLSSTFNGLHYAPTPQVLTNGAGYTISQGKGAYGEMIGYAHGVVDAELAVELAKQWHTKSQNLPGELTYTTFIDPVGGFFIPLPGREQGNQASGRQTVPGGLGGTDGGGFIDYWNEYFEDEPFVDFDGTEARGGYIEFQVPSSNSMSIETIEVKINATGGNTQFLDNVRVLLISPDGTHHELNHFFQEDPAFVTIPQNYQNQPNMMFREGGALQSTDTNPGGAFVATFTSNRSWGERSDSKLVFDPTTGEPITARGWQLHMENYSGTDFQINGIEIAFHGSPIGANTQRIQGVVGIDDNQDNAFNFSRVILNNTDTDGIIRFGEVENIIDVTHESMAANVTVVVRRASDGVIVDRFVTGADGNYYFDLVPDDYIISVEDPDGRVALEDTLSPSSVLQNYRTQWTITEEFFQVWDYDQNLRPAVDANGVPISLGLGTYHVKDINFLLDPGPPAAQQVQFNGSVLADFNGDGVLNGNDVAVPNATVYADVNRNGQLDPGETSVLTNASGQYVLTVPATFTTVINVGVIAPPNWNLSNPASGFQPLFVEPGDVFTGINFRITPPLGASAGDGSSAPGYLMGVVYEDVNNNGSRQANELGVSGIQVYIDHNNNGTREVNEPLTTTNANGAYIFGNVAPGTHRVRAIPVAPLVSINPQPNVPRIVNLAGGGTTSQIEFGIGLGSNPTVVFDYGDLPAAYGITLLGENGARHQRGAYYLGAKIDVENNGQPSPNADGDDAIGNDEDGIVFQSFNTNSGQWEDGVIPGAQGRVIATASRHGGVLQGWVDWNGDFDFNDAGERIITNIGLVTGANTVTFAIPAAVTSGNIYARFRYGEYGINSVTGPAVIGEVEDYLLAKNPSALPAVIAHGPDFDEDGDVDGRDFLILQRNMGRTNALGTQGDANGDGVVGYNDMVMWRNYYGTAAGGYAAFTAGDDGQLAALVAGQEPLEDEVAVLLDNIVEEEEAPLVEAILIVDTVGPIDAIEVSAQASTSVVPVEVDAVSVGLALQLLSGDVEVDVEDTAAIAADDLDAAFDSASDLTDLGLALKKDDSGAYRYDDEELSDESDEDNAFELAFAEGADWFQL